LLISANRGSSELLVVFLNMLLSRISEKS